MDVEPSRLPPLSADFEWERVGREEKKEKIEVPRISQKAKGNRGRKRALKPPMKNPSQSTKENRNRKEGP